MIIQFSSQSDTTITMKKVMCEEEICLVTIIRKIVTHINKINYKINSNIHNAKNHIQNHK